MIHFMLTLTCLTTQSIYNFFTFLNSFSFQTETVTIKRKSQSIIEKLKYFLAR